MRHRRVGRKLGVVTKHRKALFRNMVTDFLRNGRIETTDTRAKELRRISEKIITLAKRATLHARRQAASVIRDKEVLKKLFDEIASKYKERPGGYTRIVKLGSRRGDNAPISLLELVEEAVESKRKKKPRAATPKEPKPKKEAPKAKSQKKEAAEELGLIEAEEEKAKETLGATIPDPEKKTE
ncbi:MAG: 50S ribosomal protein L17 [Thermodesulfobacteriota bacterium]